MQIDFIYEFIGMYFATLCMYVWM